jgi:hypothetical protein
VSDSDEIWTARTIARRPLLRAGGVLTCGMLASGLLMRSGSAHAAATLPVPPSGMLAFRLIRHGGPIGTHTIKFSQQGDTLTVQIDVEVLVKFGPIPLVRYTHHGMEVWTGGRLARIEATTDKNGTRLSMSAQRTDAGLSVVGSAAPRYIAPETALPTTYWNQRLLNSPMIGTQDGMLVHPTVRDVGPYSVPAVSGTPIETTRYTLRGDLDLDLFYDQTRTWAGMEFSVADGSVIHYEPL